ncbi:hypothetical protein [uncultured Corynebacterium sp.]|uniref:hypothetical protein n=1 Tax=uncultured Corynebacterium sp. TaxID=159447 RepID=UPI0025EFCC15|nr:hypothetical protein [uncultured Corynebacterium sp.]
MINDITTLFRESGAASSRLAFATGIRLASTDEGPAVLRRLVDQGTIPDYFAAEPGSTVLIDGLSGSGKTTLAKYLAEATGTRVIHCDEFYPGWSGLMEASRIVADSVLARADAGYRRWDWTVDGPREWVGVDPAEPLIVEGVGAVTSASLEAARRRLLGQRRLRDQQQLRYQRPRRSGHPPKTHEDADIVAIEVRADAHRRQQRALHRDPGFKEFWAMWAEQEADYEASRGKPTVAIWNDLTAG